MGLVRDRMRQRWNKEKCGRAVLNKTKSKIFKICHAQNEKH